MAYLLTDLAISAALLYATTFIAHLPPVFAFVLWPLYWVAQGCVLTGVWVIAHEAGHRAFSDSVLVCDIVGWMFHSLLLVPYHRQVVVCSSAFSHVQPKQQPAFSPPYPPTHPP